MQNNRLWNIALLLAVITVFYNLAEGVISVFLGFSDDTLSLFGFGIDSFVEVVSGIGIWYMVIRTRRNQKPSETFEKTALKITGVSFYVLSFGLIVSGLYNIYSDNTPSSTLWGIIISLVSLLSMWILMSAKLSVGKKLNSDAIIADGHCTKTCLILSAILLISSTLFMIFKVGYIDSIGALGLAYYSYAEGKESFEKAEGKSCKYEKTMP
jgi:divalent metal cation (Fe/Co/Zn/Cd) transporter